MTLAARESYRVRNLPGYTLAMESTGAGGTPVRAPGDSQLTFKRGEGQRRQSTWGRPAYSEARHGALEPGGTGAPRERHEPQRRPVAAPIIRHGPAARDVVVLKFHGVQDDGYLSVPALGLTLRVDRYQSLPEEGYDVPGYLLRAYRGTSPPLSSASTSRRTEPMIGRPDLQRAPGGLRVLNIAALYHWWFLAGGLLLVVAAGALRRWPSPWLAPSRRSRAPWAGTAASPRSSCGARGPPQTVAAAVANLFGQEDAPAVEARAVMRLLFLNHNYRLVGTYYRAMPMAEQLARRGTGDAADRFAAAPLAGDLVDGERRAPGRDAQLGAGQQRRGLRPAGQRAALLHALAHRYDIVHMFDHKPNATFAGLAARPGARLVADWADWWGGAAGSTTCRSGAARRRALRVVVGDESKRWADGVVTISRVLGSGRWTWAARRPGALSADRRASRPHPASAGRRGSAAAGAPAERRMVGFIGMGQGDLEIVMDALRPAAAMCG